MQGEQGSCRWPALDGLRGLAVVAVVVYHFAPSVLPGGFLGVDLFFVLSGFLITGLILKEFRATGRVDLRAFWGRRFRRLLPAALLTLAGILAVAWFTGTLTSSLRGDVFAALGYHANWHQVSTGQSYFAVFGPANPTKHFWSLAIEEQFYLLWPVLLWVVLAVASRRRHPTRLILVVLGLATALSAGWMAVLHDAHGDPSRVYFGTDTRSFELLIGAFLAVVMVDRFDRRATGATRAMSGRRREWVLAVGTVAVAFGCVGAMRWWNDQSEVYYRGGAVAWCVGIAWLIVAAAGTGPVSAVLAWRPLRALGLISYGIYLVHWPVSVWIDESSTGATGWRLFAVRVVITIGIATASAWLVELPIRRGSLLPRGPVPRFSAVAAVGALVVALVALPGAGPDASDVDVAAGAEPNTAIVFADGPPLPAAPAPTVGDPPVSASRSLMGMRADATPGAALATSGAGTDDQWTPPPPTPALPTAQARHEAEVSLVNACAGKSQPPLAEYRNNGTGRLVAVIGDSMTAQMRNHLLDDRRFDWYVLARCGTPVYSFDHPDPRATPGLPEAFAQLIALRPAALVIALGVSDLGYRLPYEASMRSLIDMTASVPCRSWVNLFVNPNIDRRVPDGDVAFKDFNDALNRSLAGTDVRLLDWSRRAAAVPINEHGYHPWLNPADWVHLLPGEGFAQRADLMTSDLARCFA